MATRARVQQGTYTHDSASPTIGEACQAWLDRAAAEGLERGTQLMYAEHKAHILAAIDGKTKLSRLSPAECEQLRDDLLRRHSRDMARKVLQSVKACSRMPSGAD